MPSGQDCIPFPPHAYVPGQNARHPEDWFDAIKATVGTDTPLDDLHETQAFRAGLAYLEAGFFWECHEVLEAVWMQAPVGTPQREMVQALIQLANARLKLCMARPRAVLRLCAMIEAHLARCPSGKPVVGMLVADVQAEVDGVRRDCGA